MLGEITAGRKVSRVTTVQELIEQTEMFRFEASRKLDPKLRADLGQFFTPASVSRYMAGMFLCNSSQIRLLDAGAGVGSLTAAFVADMCQRPERPEEICVTAYEIDATLVSYLKKTLDACENVCRLSGVRFFWEVLEEDFISAGITQITGNLFAPRTERRFNAVIMNPPYKKIHSRSKVRELLRTVGIETSNMYAAFLSIAVRLLERDGELVAITPRSFCNGPYFRSFREDFLRTMTFRQIHTFESRTRAFGDDDVLQENVVFHAIKSQDRGRNVLVSSSDGPDDEVTVREIPYTKLVNPTDPQLFIRLVKDESDHQVDERMSLLTTSLSDLDIDVSTGRVVDFRAKEFLRQDPDSNTVPLIYPLHFDGGYVTWPKVGSKKPNALIYCKETENLLVASGYYVLVKRFSSKEEARRIVAVVFDPARVTAPWVGFENHLNYFHRRGAGLPATLAKGLAVYLNSTFVDIYFRQFNGHTQVNATDLKNIRYPSLDQLMALGARVDGRFPNQQAIDRWVEEVIFTPNVTK